MLKPCQLHQLRGSIELFHPMENYPVRSRHKSMLDEGAWLVWSHSHKFSNLHRHLKTWPPVWFVVLFSTSLSFTALVFHMPMLLCKRFLLLDFYIYSIKETEDGRVTHRGRTETTKMFLFSFKCSSPPTDLLAPVAASLFGKNFSNPKWNAQGIQNQWKKSLTWPQNTLAIQCTIKTPLGGLPELSERTNGNLFWWNAAHFLWTSDVFCNKDGGHVNNGSSYWLVEGEAHVFRCTIWRINSGLIMETQSLKQTFLTWVLTNEILLQLFATNTTTFVKSHIIALPKEVYFLSWERHLSSYK